MNIKPIQASNRIIYLDILRGMAILFIFIANIYTFSGWNFLPDVAKAQFDGAQLNSIIKQLTVVFIDGKWYSIFSILFGIGFAIQYENAKSRNISFVSFFSKRMLGLLFFGFLHLFFLWVGDILALYALLGFVLILFRNVTSRKLLIWAGVLMFLPVVHLLIMVGLDDFYPLGLMELATTYFTNNGIPIVMNNGELDLYAFSQIWLDGDSFEQFSTITFGMPWIRCMNLLLEGRIFKVLACFLIGLWAGREIIHNELLKNRVLLKKILFYGFLIGIPMNILLAYSKTQPEGVWTIVNYTSYAFGVIPLACAYSALVALLVLKGHNYLLKLAPVGQMALSNYIFHTIISTTIYYGIGFGYAFDTSLWLVIVIALIIFALQIVFSTYWLRHFRFGPLEWLWRMMTYQKYIKNKK